MKVSASWGYTTKVKLWVSRNKKNNMSQKNACIILLAKKPGRLAFYSQQEATRILLGQALRDRPREMPNQLRSVHELVYLQASMFQGICIGSAIKWFTISGPFEVSLIEMVEQLSWTIHWVSRVVIHPLLWPAFSQSPPLQTWIFDTTKLPQFSTNLGRTSSEYMNHIKLQLKFYSSSFTKVEDTISVLELFCAYDDDKSNHACAWSYLQVA